MTKRMSCSSRCATIHSVCRTYASGKSFAMFCVSGSTTSVHVPGGASHGISGTCEAWGGKSAARVCAHDSRAKGAAATAVPRVLRKIRRFMWNDSEGMPLRKGSGWIRQGGRGFMPRRFELREFLSGHKAPPTAFNARSECWDVHHERTVPQL